MVLSESWALGEDVESRSDVRLHCEKFLTALARDLKHGLSAVRMIKSKDVAYEEDIQLLPKSSEFVSLDCDFQMFDYPAKTRYVGRDLEGKLCQFLETNTDRIHRIFREPFL